MSSVVPSAEILSDWAPQRQMTLEQARRRSRFIGLMRMLFVAGAAISAGVLIGPIAASTLNGTGTSLENLQGDQVVTMVNARFTGRNLAGDAYEITAETATRRLNDPGVIDLIKPRMIDDSGVEVTAPTGIYHQKSAFLDLSKIVRVRDEEGYEFTTNAARVFVQEGRVQGLEPLNGIGPLGEVRADTYEITDDGDRVVLRGNVDMVIYPSRRDDPAGETN